MKTALESAVEAVGTQVELARRIGVRQSTLWGWLKRNGSPVPAEYAGAIEQATGGAVTRYQLRPDVFGEQPAQTEAA